MSQDTSDDGPLSDPPHSAEGVFRSELAAYWRHDVARARLHLARARAGFAAFRASVNRTWRRRGNEHPFARAIRVVTVDPAELHHQTKLILPCWRLLTENTQRDQAELVRLRPRFRQLAVRAAAKEMVVGRTTERLFLSGALLIIPTHFLIMATYFGVSFLTNAFALLFVGFLVVLLHICQRELLRRDGVLYRISNYLALAGLLVCACAGLYIRLEIPIRRRFPAEHFEVTCVQAAGLFFVMSVVLSVLIILGEDRVRKDWARADPAAACLGWLWTALEIERTAGVYLTPDKRRKIMQCLGQVSVILGRHLAPQLRTGNPATNDVVLARVREASLAVRDYQIWVALPTPQTYADLRVKLTLLIGVLATGEYDDLPRRDPHLTGHGRRTLTSRAVEVLRVAVTASFPVVTLFVLDRFGLQIKAQWFAAAYLWALVVLLTVIDPNLQTRLNAFKDVVAQTPLGKDSKDGKNKNG